jgi:hypothetical protein
VVQKESDITVLTSKKQHILKNPSCNTTVASLQAARNESDIDCVILHTRYVVFPETKKSQQNVPKEKKNTLKQIRKDALEEKWYEVREVEQPKAIQEGTNAEKEETHRNGN